MRLRIEDMSCSGCAKAVTRAIQGVDPAAKVEVNLETKLVEVATAADAKALEAALTEAGYTPKIENLAA